MLTTDAPDAELPARVPEDEPDPGSLAGCRRLRCCRAAGARGAGLSIDRHDFSELIAPYAGAQPSLRSSRPGRHPTSPR